LTNCSGIYVPHDDRWPEHFRGMGIRIEDSVCVREKSVLVFTTEAVKEVKFSPANAFSVAVDANFPSLGR
jgi:hypothetical protein